MFSLNKVNRAITSAVEAQIEMKPRDILARSTHQLQLPDDPVEWTQKVRILKGGHFSFEEREYLKQIYRDQTKEIYIVKPRQMEITAFALNWLLYPLTKNPGTVGLYLSARQDHVSVFSK